MFICAAVVAARCCRVDKGLHVGTFRMITTVVITSLGMIGVVVLSVEKIMQTSLCRSDHDRLKKSDNITSKGDAFLLFSSLYIIG
jgi:hypothetical protein